MGFPDIDDNHEEGPPTSILDGFRSWINRKPVKTKFVSLTPAECYWVKRVHFAPGETKVVVDSYSTWYGAVSAGLPEDEPRYRYARYVLTTGATWRGSIGKVTLIVNFADDCKPRPYRWEPSSSKDEGYDDSIDNHLRARREYERRKRVGEYSGLPCVAKSNRKLIFYAENLSPSDEFDLVYTEPLSSAVSKSH